MLDSGHATGTIPYTHIPQEQWRSFFDNYSRDKVNMPVTVDVETPQMGAHRLAHDAPLLGVTAAEEGGQCTIELILGPPEGHVSHTIRNPERVTVIPAPDRRSCSLEIESHDAEVVTIHWQDSQHCGQ